MKNGGNRQECRDTIAGVLQLWIILFVLSLSA